MSSILDVGIIVPTYNPEERILSRTLDSVAGLNAEGAHIRECVIVDNNSTPAVETHPYVQQFLKRCPWARIVREQKQGLIHARIAGIRATTSELIVVVDDDNVMDPEYARLAVELMREYPTVGIWGPGIVSVQFLDPVPDSLREFAKLANCERSHSEMAYGCVPRSWQPYYPTGMGQVVRRKVAQRYVDAVERGELNATGRTGKSLASGEDIQIVWEAIKMGLAGGIHPDLRIEHLVPARRATMSYFCRLVFGLASSFKPAFVESFPPAAPADKEPPRGPTTPSILKQLARTAYRSLRARKSQFVRVELARCLGHAYGQLRAAGAGNDHWVLRLSQKAGLV